MVNSIHIKNFKSVVDLELDLGYFNVLIGENGCGKSNILEAIAFGGAAIADKLDHEFMSSRGIRLTQPKFMVSAFDTTTIKRPTIEIFVRENQKKVNIVLSQSLHNGNNWEFDTAKIFKKIFEEVMRILISDKNESEKRERISQIEIIGVDKSSIDELIKLGRLFEGVDMKDPAFAEEFIVKSLANGYVSVFEKDFSINHFIVYSPEQTSLRKFEDSSRITPLGIKGEGLFQFLKEITTSKKTQKQLLEIKQSLSLLDWYSELTIPSDLLSTEYKLNIRDRYIKDTLGFFDQRSTNEGFLYLLFYFTLFTSKETPAFFAIDNIDTALNPKLCSELIRQLAKLAKKHKKQVILTTHNPAVLDGLNLKNDGQRLFVVRRNEEGHTKAKRIEYKPERTMKLSEVWTKGFIGGLPDNF